MNFFQFNKLVVIILLGWAEQLPAGTIIRAMKINYVSFRRSLLIGESVGKTLPPGFGGEKCKF